MNKRISGCVLVMAVIFAAAGFPARGAWAAEAPAAAASSSAGGEPSPWARADVDRAVLLGLAPADLRSSYTLPVTRAEFCAAAVLFCETQTGAVITRLSRFEDTDDLNVMKMAGLGVAAGVGGGRFAPDEPLTREQAAAILARLADVMGMPLTDRDQALAQAASYADAAGISVWAAVSVGQMRAAGVMVSTGGNEFSPKSPYTREQGIVTVLRLYDALKNMPPAEAQTAEQAAPEAATPKPAVPEPAATPKPAAPEAAAPAPAATPAPARNYDYKAWGLGCGAILAERNGFDPYEYGMLDANAVGSAESMRAMLKSSWGVGGRADLIDLIGRMTDNGHSAEFAGAYDYVSSLSAAEYQNLLSRLSGNETYMWPLTKALGDKWGGRRIKAWDWFRMIHLAAWGYVAGYVDLEESHGLMDPVIDRLRANFSSWDEATDNYMDGYAWWSRTDVSLPGTEYRTRLGIYEDLKASGGAALFDPSVWK
ncbi:MAG: DUF1266 domain-containing protein [Firmicutes bacterium]|nr:DUF1266 domain-containing protein [Bacillota bacterium]